MVNYEINEETLAIIGIDYEKTEVLEKENQYHVDSTAYEVMDYSCQYFGSSYQGRVAGSKSLLKANYKLPIIVEESKNMIFFPTMSPTMECCTWISLKDIKYYNGTGNKTEITFKNGKTITIPVSKSSIENQILRASRLSCILLDRKNGKKENN